MERIHIVFSDFDQFNQLFHVLLFIRDFPSQHHKKYDPQRPNITHLIVWFLLDDFWSHVQHGANHLLHQFLWVELAGQAKINQLYLEVIPINNDIFCFDVSVTHVTLVAVIYGLQNLF